MRKASIRIVEREGAVPEAFRCRKLGLMLFLAQNLRKPFTKGHHVIGFDLKGTQ